MRQSSEHLTNTAYALQKLFMESFQQYRSAPCFSVDVLDTPVLLGSPDISTGAKLCVPTGNLCIVSVLLTNDPLSNLHVRDLAVAIDW